MLSGSMTAAAESLHTSQPNISRLIAQLERGSGFRLFERVGSRLMPTDEGAALFADVQRAFIGLQSLEKSVQAIRQSGTGRLRIAAVPSLSSSVLPKVVKRFVQENPGVAISLHTNDSPMVNQWAASQFCDVGLVSYISEDMPGLKIQTVCDVPGVCIFPKGHRLNSLDTVTPKDLEGEEFISLSQNDGSRAKVDRAFPADGGRRKLKLETPHAATICSLVALELGVSIVSPIVAMEYLHTGIETRPFYPEVRFTTYLVLPAERPHGLLTLRFVELVREMLSETAQTVQTGQLI